MIYNCVVFKYTCTQLKMMLVGFHGQQSQRDALYIIVYRAYILHAHSKSSSYVGMIMFWFAIEPELPGIQPLYKFVFTIIMILDIIFFL